MAKYVALPNLGDAGPGTENPPGTTPNISIYTLGTSGASFLRLIDYSTTNPTTSPNYVVLYHDASLSTNPCYMLVSCVYINGPNGIYNGQINVYQYDGLDIIANGPDPAPNPTLLQYAPVGMAIQPGTGDLYVASYNGGVYVYTNSSGYTEEIVFSSDTGFVPGAICANLAFDNDGNLWLSSFNGTTVSTHLLTCYTQVGRIGTPESDSTQYIQFGNGSTPNFTVIASPGVTAPTSMYYPLAEPNGIAFDPDGNLWVANNDDDQPLNLPSGSGTLLRVSRKWIDNIFSTATNQSLETIVPSTPGSPAGTVYCVQSYDKFGSLYFDGYTLYVEDEGEKQVYQFDTTGITDTSPSPPNVTESGISASYPGNGGLALFNTTPPNLLIRRLPGDSGGQIAMGPNVYESPDIAATTMSITTQNFPNVTVTQAEPGGVIVSTLIPNQPANASNDGITLAAQSIYGTITAYVQVRVANNGGMKDPSSSGTEVLKLYWAYASSGLGWPRPWDGQSVNSDGVFTGGLIGATQIGVISPGYEAIFEFTWTNVPNPESYADTSGHFCLVARIEGNSLYPFDMAYPELTNVIGGSNVLAKNVLDNSTIAWHNITILPRPAKHRGRHISLASPSSVPIIRFRRRSPGLRSRCWTGKGDRLVSTAK